MCYFQILNGLNIFEGGEKFEHFDGKVACGSGVRESVLLPKFLNRENWLRVAVEREERKSEEGLSGYKVSALIYGQD